MYVCMYVCIYIYIYIHTHTYTHKHTYIHKLHGGRPGRPAQTPPLRLPTRARPEGFSPQKRMMRWIH